MWLRDEKGIYYFPHITSITIDNENTVHLHTEGPRKSTIIASFDSHEKCKTFLTRMFTAIRSRDEFIDIEIMKNRINSEDTV